MKLEYKTIYEKKKEKKKKENYNYHLILLNSLSEEKSNLQF